MAKVKFIKDFATKKKGEEWECDGQLASHLVRVAKVAEYTEEQVAIHDDLKAKAKAEADEIKKRADKQAKSEAKRVADLNKKNKKDKK